jgi:quercetin dioxygenase-like cupin family protein
MKRVLLLGLAVSLAGSTAGAKTAELKWMDGPPGLPGGAQFAVVSGNPAKAGKFTIQIRMPANYSVPPHWHPSDEHVTLLSGKLAYGMTNRFDRANATALAPGSSIVMKAKMNHWVFSGDGAELQVSATGPFKITYANPADDPRPKTAATK